MNRAMALALSCCEINAAMGKICAAPTAGSCGILPAVLISMKERYALEEDKVYEGYADSLRYRRCCYEKRHLAGAEGGCQAECGVAAAMAAAAAVHMCGGTSAMCANALRLCPDECYGPGLRPGRRACAASLRHAKCFPGSQCTDLPQIWP